MSELPEKIVRFDAVRIEYGKRKMCQCYSPHYEIDYQNKLVYCLDCGAIVDPLEALMRIARTPSGGTITRRSCWSSAGRL